MFSVIDKALFLNISHRFDEDLVYGEIVRRFRIWKGTKNDLKTINSRHIANENVTSPPFTQLKCACYVNFEINAYTNTVFLKRLKATHHKKDNTLVEYPSHTCIIKASMRNKENVENLLMSCTIDFLMSVVIMILLIQNNLL